MNNYNNVLLVSGAGRNVGKSTLVSRIISRFKGKDIVAVKVSPHFHSEIPDGIPYIIEEEKNPDRSKDSSRFLKAGASKVYYIQVLDEHLYKAFQEVYHITGTQLPIIIESGGLSNIIVPGLLLFVEGENPAKKNILIRNKADKILQIKKGFYEVDDITFQNGQWKLKSM